MQEEKSSINKIMNTDTNDISFQEFLDQKMKEIKDGVTQNIIRKKKEQQRKIENQTMPLNLGDKKDDKVYDMRNPDDAEIVNSKFNQMMDDLRKQYPTLKQIKTQYPNG